MVLPVRVFTLEIKWLISTVHALCSCLPLGSFSKRSSMASKSSATRLESGLYFKVITNFYTVADRRFHRTAYTVACTLNVSSSVGTADYEEARFLGGPHLPYSQEESVG
jgi:hypothetical protein